MAYKLVAFDLDGTLLNSQHEFSFRTKEMLRRLLDKGIHIVFASGRPCTVLRRLARQLPMFHGPNAIPLSTSSRTRFLCAGSNGSVVCDEEQNCLYSEHVCPRMCAALFDLLPHDPEINLNVYRTVTPTLRQEPGYVNWSDQPGDPAMEEWLCRYRDEREVAAFQDSGFIPKAVPYSTPLVTSDINGLYYVVYDPAKCSKLEEAAQNAIDRVEKELGVCGTMSMVHSAPHCLSISSRTVSKAAALKRICATIGVPLFQCAAFGDGMNDVEMLREVGKGFIMGNANPKLKAALPEAEVIGTNDEDAVAVVVEKLFDL